MKQFSKLFSCRILISISLTALSVLSIPNIKGQTFGAASASIDVLDYRAQIEPDINRRSVSGTVKIRFISLTNNLKTVEFDSGALLIDEVSENRIAQKYEKLKNRLTVALARAANINESRELEIKYHGQPRFGIKFFPARQQVYTEFSTSQWLVCLDSPEERATFHLSLILLKGLKAVGNGQLLKQNNLPNNKTLYEWEQTKPIPSYTFGFAAGRFREATEKYGDVQLRYLAAAFSNVQLKQIFRDTADIIGFYEDRTGVRYADTAYTQVLVAGDDAAQEMSSFTVMYEDYGREVLKDNRQLWLGAHELAHQWWGNMVTNRDWRHFWLNEGMATFMTAAYKEHRFGRVEYLKEIEKYRLRYEQVRIAGNDKSLVFPDWDKPTKNDRTLVYYKGAYVIYLLREELGDKAFWAGIRAYTQKYFGKSVTTADFKETMEKSAGKDLNEFFNKWIYFSKV